jgi:hypothetical protein
VNLLDSALAVEEGKTAMSDTSWISSFGVLYRKFEGACRGDDFGILE